MFSKGKGSKEEKPFKNAVFKESLMVILFLFLTFYVAEFLFADIYFTWLSFIVLFVFYCLWSKNALAVVKRILIMTFATWAIIQLFWALFFNPNLNPSRDVFPSVWMRVFQVLLGLVFINFLILRSRKKRFGEADDKNDTSS